MKIVRQWFDTEGNKTGQITNRRLHCTYKAGLKTRRQIQKWQRKVQKMRLKGLSVVTELFFSKQLRSRQRNVDLRWRLTVYVIK